MNSEINVIYEQVREIARQEIQKYLSSDKWGTAQSDSSDGSVEVLFDNGETATPCKTVVRVKDGDRVMLNVDPVSRSAIVKGNYTRPSATDDDLTDAAKYAAQVADFVDYSPTAPKTLAQRVTQAERDIDSMSVYVEAYDELSELDTVTGVADWAVAHGTFAPTSDNSPKSGKRYFERTTSGSVTRYSLVASPTGNPSAIGLYELSGVDETLAGFVIGLAEGAADLEAKVASLEGKAADLEAKVASLEGKAADLEAKVASLEGKAEQEEGGEA